MTWSMWSLIFFQYLCTEWSMWLFIFIQYSCTEWSTWSPAVRMQQSTLIHSIFLSYFNFISLQSYCSFIQFFHALAAFYCHWGRRHFSKGAFVTDTVLPWHLVSPDYSPCAGQIYISVRSSIALRKLSILLLLYCAYGLLQSFYSLLTLINVLGGE